MQISVETVSNLERKITVALPSSTIDAAVEQKLQDTARRAKFDGFRPGKVPYAVIKKQFGGQVRGDAVSDLIREGYSEAVGKENLRPAGGPRIEPIELGEGNDLKFAAVFEVMPEVALQPVEDIAVERTTCDITEADIVIPKSEILRDTFRSGGKGGQNVNKVETAVRITHLPTGLVVIQQDEKSQHKNKAKAMRVLRSRLLEEPQKRENEARASARRTLIGSGDRSEKIRTYNFPQSTSSITARSYRLAREASLSERVQ